MSIDTEMAYETIREVLEQVVALPDLSIRYVEMSQTGNTTMAHALLGLMGIQLVFQMEAERAEHEALVAQKQEPLPDIPPKAKAI